MKRSHLILLAALMAVAAVEAEAQTWPTRPLKAIVPVAAGTLADIVPRIVFEQLALQIGQSIVVENRPGGGTTTGASLVAKSDPDGYTLLVNSSAHTIAPSLYANLSYDTGRDLLPVAPLGITPFVLVAPPARGFKTARELVTAAQAKPGSFNFASLGIGTASHLSVERFRLSAGVQAAHVPFKGAPEALTEVIAGRIDFYFVALGGGLPFINDGKLTALAVNGARRAAALPDVPTTLEAGFTNAEYPIWFGIFLPAKCPRAIVDKLHAETLRALEDPKVRHKLGELGLDPMVMTQADFDGFVRKEVGINAELVKAIGLKPL